MKTYLPCLVALCIPTLLQGGEKGDSPPGRLEGIVRYEGPIPKPVAVPDASTVRPVIEVDKKSKGIKNVAIWLEGVTVPVDLKPPKPAFVDQANFFFDPHVLTIQNGQEVEFFNSDSANHGVLAASFEAKNTFNAVTPPNGSYKHRFVTSKRPVQIGCPYHAGMRAWIWVFDHPYHTVSTASGSFKLPPVPPGEYRLHLRHQEGTLKKEISIKIEPGKTLSLDIKLEKLGR